LYIAAKSPGVCALANPAEAISSATIVRIIYFGTRVV